METIKRLLNEYGRPLAAKYLARALLYGGTVLSAKLGIDAPDGDTTTKLAAWGAAALCGLAAYLMDRWHARKDLAEVPPPPAQ